MTPCPHPKKQARGMCSRCYQAARRAGTLEPKEPPLASVTLRAPIAVLQMAEEAANAADQSLSTWVRAAVEQRLLREQAGLRRPRSKRS